MMAHLNDKRCKSLIINDYVRINNIMEDIDSKNILIESHKKELEEKENTIIAQRKQIESILSQINEKDLIINAHEHSQVNNKCNNINNINMKVEIIVNSINKLDVNYLEHQKMKEMIEKYDNDKELKAGIDCFNGDKVNLLLGDYIKDIICNKEHPENHTVKYIKKKPPTYNTHIEDADGNTVTVIKGLKDTCELLSDPILNKLKKKMIEFCKKYHKDDLPEFDYTLYENAIKELKKELNKSNVKRALNSVLKNDILNNIEMKLTKPHISPPKNKQEKIEINPQV